MVDDDIFSEEDEWVSLEKRKPYIESIDIARLLLVVVGALGVLGLPTSLGNYIQKIFEFAPYAFFVISGYLILGNKNDERRKINATLTKSSVILFIVFAFYLFFNYLFYLPLGFNLLSLLSTISYWLNTVIIGTWILPVGENFWYLEAYFFGYALVWLLSVTKLIRFDIFICIPLFALSLLTGELSSIWGIFKFPPNFFTVALPCLLLGRFISRKEEWFKRFSNTVYLIICLVSAFLIALEFHIIKHIKILTNTEHMITYFFLAFFFCILAIKVELPEIGVKKILKHSVGYIYFSAQPIGVIIALLLVKIVGNKNFDKYSGFIGIVTVHIVVAIAFGIEFLFYKLKKIEKHKKEEYNGEPDLE